MINLKIWADKEKQAVMIEFEAPLEGIGFEIDRCKSFIQILTDRIAELEEISTNASIK